MIELYCSPQCAVCEEYEDALKEMVLAHKVIIVPLDKRPADLPDGMNLPILKDEKEFITGHEAITARLQALEKIVYAWHTYQGDACYVKE